MSYLQEKMYAKTIKYIQENMRFGIELEGIFNEDKVAFDIDDVAEYHNGCYSLEEEFFRLEEDSSLQSMHCNFNSYIIAELISKPIKYKEINTYFDKLKSVLNCKDSFYNIVEFNKSMGCHTHISIKNNKIIKNIVDIDVIDAINKNIIAFLNENDYFYKGVAANYYRKFAKKVTEKNITERDVSINRLTSYATIELRSLNLNGVKSITGMYFLFKNVLDIVACAIADSVIKNTNKKMIKMYLNKNIPLKCEVKNVLINV